MGTDLYGVVFTDGHIEWHQSFDSAWNESRGVMNTTEIVLATVYTDGRYEIKERLINL